MNEQEDTLLKSQGLLANRQFQRGAILLAILIGFALRFFRLDFQELSQWEAMDYVVSQFSFSQLVDFFSQGGVPVVVGGFWMQHFWFSLAGTSEFAMRLLSALCGSLAIPLVFRLAKELRLERIRHSHGNLIDGIELVRHLEQPGCSSPSAHSGPNRRKRLDGFENNRWYF